MMRAPLAAAVLLVVAAIGVGVAPASLQVVAANETADEDAPIYRIAHLTLGDDGSAGLTNQSVDAASAVSIGRDDAAARFEDYATAERLNRTTDTNAALDGAIDDLEARVATLEADERSVRRQHANGSTSARQFVHDVAHVQARSARLEDRLARLEETAARYGNDTHRDRIDRLERRLLGYTGPVRERALDAVTGTRDALALYAAASDRGTVLAVLDGGEYVREAYRADRQAEAPDGISFLAALDRFEELYPVAVTFSGQVSAKGLNGRNKTYQIEKLLPFGSLLVLLDGNTRDIFHEVQRRQLGSMDQPASATATANGTRLVVNRTHAGGPLRIATYDADGRPTAAAVRVGDRRVGTGEDGVVWTLMPPESRVEVAATTPDGTVSLAVEPVAFTPVNGTSGS
jgi:hypothetical protein